MIKTHQATCGPAISAKMNSASSIAAIHEHDGHVQTAKRAGYLSS